MPRRALAEKRPLLLASIAAALGFYYLRWGPWPELYLIPLKGAAVGLLAIYLWQRHASPDARLLAWAFGAAALGDMALEIATDRLVGGLLFFAYHVMAMGAYLRNRRPRLTPSQKWAVSAMLLLTPVIAWFMPADRGQAANVALYALALGAMAASAWASVFPRYRVGAGAVLFLLSDLLLFAEMGPLQGHIVPQILVWPVYYLGQLLIATGVAQTLRKRDPELRIVAND
ncbi:MAG TPA: lysoplasmalogenase family protein [Croceibacterium sp.]|nr:lysoplasmalogenase family protein [Croceibacterium sp.]